MKARKHISLAEFKKAAKAGQLDADQEYVLHKGLPDAEVKAEDDATRTITFTISTAAVDRDDDTIAVEGWELANYLKNPVVLWGHDHVSPPIAKALATWVEGGKLKSKAQFHQEFEFADMVYRLFKGGYMNATSVGFMPKTYVVNEERPGNGWGPAFDFKSQELLEYSAVPIPANPEALQDAGAKGINLAPMVEWAERVLDSGATLVLPVEREAVEAVRKSLLPKWGKAPAPVGPQIDMDALVKRLADELTTRGLVTSKAEPAEVAAPATPDEPAPSEAKAPQHCKGCSDDDCEGCTGTDKAAHCKSCEMEDCPGVDMSGDKAADEIELDPEPADETEELGLDPDLMEEAAVAEVERAAALIAKIGAISASNEARLRRACDLLSEVITQAEPEDEAGVDLDDETIKALPGMIQAAVDHAVRCQRGALD